MKAQDFTNQNNNRAHAIQAIQAFCDDHGYSYKYTEKEFTIMLPDIEPIPVVPIAGKKRKTFDISSWGEKSIDESDLPTELPPTTTPLEEGEPPVGDEEA